MNRQTRRSWMKIAKAAFPFLSVALCYTSTGFAESTKLQVTGTATTVANMTGVSVNDPITITGPLLKS